jgi:hypothetical protein
MNWVGARQQLKKGGGSENFPAITPMAFAGQKRPIEEISAFSLALTRYTDAVDAAVFSDPKTFNSDLSNSDELWKWVDAVEGTDEAARMLGYSFGSENSDIVIGVNFTPYTNNQAEALVKVLRERAITDERFRQAFCSATMLQKQYQALMGEPAITSNIEC